MGFPLRDMSCLERISGRSPKIHPDLGCSLGEELLKPTHIYVKEVIEILKQGIPVKALIHITSDGFLNLTRVQSKASYIIDSLPSPPAIFSLIQTAGNVKSAEMFSVYNMGIGFCLVIPEREASRVCSTIKMYGKEAHRIGYAKTDRQGKVDIPYYGLTGTGKKFRK